MAGTGNLLLKRGTTIPADGTLPKAMPAVQLIATSPEVNNKAYVNYPNRLWVGMDGVNSPNADTCTSGQFSWTSAESNTGAAGTSFGQAISCSASGVTINNTRPLWMGAEIRAFTPLDDSNNAGAPTILEADWVSPSDYVLVTQKSIYEWVNSTFTKGNNNSVRLVETVDTAGDYIEFQAPGNVDTGNYILVLPSGLPAAGTEAGKSLNISSVSGNVATLIWSTPGTASVAAKVSLEETSTNATHYITFVDAFSGDENVRTDQGITYNPSTNTLTTTTFSGGLSGNASSATNLAGGAAGSVPYQTGSGATTFLADPNTEGVILTYNNTSNAPAWTSPSSITVGTASVASTVALIQTETATGAHYITFVDTASGNENVRTDTGLSYVPSTNTITTSAMNLVGSLGLTTQKIANNDTLEINAAGGSGTVIRGSQNFAGDSTRPTLSVDPSQLVGSNTQFVRINGGDLYLGNKSIDGSTNTPVNIIFEGVTNSGTTNRTTLTVADPSQANTVTIPNQSGTFILVDSNLDCISRIRNLSITGDLEINGTTTTVNTTDLNVEDTIVTLQYNYTGNSPSDSGIQIERGSAGADVQLLWDESETKWSANRNGTNLYPLTISDSNSTLHGAGTEGSGDTANGKLGVQYVHSAAIKYLDVKNLVMSGTWTLNATITSNLDLKDGGLKLPYVNGAFHASSGNDLTGLPEGHIAYDIQTNKALLNIGSLTSTTVDNPDLPSQGTVTQIPIVTESQTQTLLNKTLTLPKINDTSSNNTYTFAVSELNADRTVTLPLLTGNDTFVFEAHSQTLTNKTIDNIKASAAGANTSLHTEVTSGSIAIGAGVTTGSITLGGATGFIGTINLANGANTSTSGTKTINIGTSGGSSGSTKVTIGSCSSGHTSSIVEIGCPSSTTKKVFIQNKELVFGVNGGNNQVTLAPVAITVTSPTHSFPDVTSGNLVVASTTNFNQPGYLLAGGSSTTSPSVYTDPENVVVGGVYFRNETTGSGATRYPIAFFASQLSTDNPSTFGALSPDNVKTTGYLKTHWSTAEDQGLYYAPGDTTTGNQPSVNGGTLYAGFFAGYLDCGEY